jgi:hypothetical protein
MTIDGVNGEDCVLADIGVTMFLFMSRAFQGMLQDTTDMAVAAVPAVLVREVCKESVRSCHRHTHWDAGGHS